MMLHFQDKNKFSYISFLSTTNNITVNTDYFYLIFVGRTNVGKSSFINLLANKKIAISSKKPGSTKLLNIYKNESLKFFIVDTPGYGYSVSSRVHREIVEKNMLNLLNKILKNNFNYLIVIFIDSKISFTKNDQNIIKMLSDNNIDYIIVFTKYDKINQSQKHALSKKIFNYNIKSEKYIYSSTKTNAMISENFFNLWTKKVNKKF